MTDHLYLLIGIALIISALMPIPLIIILAYQLRHIKIQTDYLSEEIGNRMRPWIKINTIFASRGETKDHIKAWKECKSTDDIVKIHFTCNIENIGLLPVYDFYIKICSRNSVFDKNNFGNMVTATYKTSLLPGEDFQVNYILTPDQYNMLNEDPYYYGVHVRYSYSKNKYASIGKIFKLLQIAVSHEDEWYDEPPNMKYV